MSLSMMQEMMIRDNSGRCRCPWCGKYRKESDFPEQNHHANFGNEKLYGHIHVPPMCNDCLPGKEAGDDA